MKEYLKMSDAFEDGQVTSDGVELWDESGWIGDSLNHKYAEYSAHAINSHDELVAEVERLKKAVELARMTLDEVDRVLTERIRNGAYDLDDISAEVECAIKRLSETE